MKTSLRGYPESAVVDASSSQPPASDGPCLLRGDRLFRIRRRSCELALVRDVVRLRREWRVTLGQIIIAHSVSRLLIRGIRVHGHKIRLRVEGESRDRNLQQLLRALHDHVRNLPAHLVCHHLRDAPDLGTVRRSGLKPYKPTLFQSKTSK